MKAKVGEMPGHQILMIVLCDELNLQSGQCSYKKGMKDCYPANQTSISAERKTTGK